MQIPSKFYLSTSPCCTLIKGETDAKAEPIVTRLHVEKRTQMSGTQAGTSETRRFPAPLLSADSDQY